MLEEEWWKIQGWMEYEPRTRSLCANWTWFDLIKFDLDLILIWLDMIWLNKGLIWFDKNPMILQENEWKPNVNDNAPMSKVEDWWKIEFEEDVNGFRKIDYGGRCKWIELGIDWKRMKFDKELD